MLIADEPTGNLDTETGKQIADLLFKEQAERGMTLLLVTHDHKLAARCQRQVRVRSGEILSEEKCRRKSGGGRVNGAANSSLSPMAELKLAWRLARREMRGGLSGFYIFLACIALGTAAIAGVNSVSRSITTAITEEGQVILGADIRFELQNRAAEPDELSFLDSQGTMTQTIGLRSMTRLPDGSDQTLVEAKAVDPRYPLYGSLETTPSLGFDALFSAEDGVYGVAVAPLLLDRLGVEVGDHVLLGNAEFEIRAVIDSEPDALSDGFGFAPRLMFSRGGLAAAGLIQVGSLVEYAYKLKLSPGASDANIRQLRGNGGK